MNIATTGAAVVMMGNTNRRMRGGYSGGNESEEKPKGFFNRWGLLLFNTLTFFLMVIPTALDVSQSDFFYMDVHSTVIEKKIVSERGSKGRVYDEGYLKLQYANGNTRWVNVGMTDYLNTNEGANRVSRVQKPQSPLTFWRWVMGISALLWCAGAATALSRIM